MLKTVYIPESVYTGIHKLKADYPKRINIYGADIETKPYLLIGFENEIIKTTPENITSDFLKIANKYTHDDYFNVVWFHNLRFDIQVIFLKYADYFNENSFFIYFNSEYKEILEDEYLDNGGIKVEIKIGKCVFSSITFTKGRILHIYDTFQFFKDSLKNISIQLDLEHKKIDEYNEFSDYNSFCKYLTLDVLTVKDLGKLICSVHKQYNIPVSVSIANMSGKIFRKHFFDSKMRIPFIDSFWIKRCEFSYHGGKNGYYLDGVIKIKNVYEYDIISAYPKAMLEIPNFCNCDYKQVEEFVNDYEGVYIISGYIKKSKYTLFFTHDFKPISNQEIVISKKDITKIKEMPYHYYVKNLCLTSYEIRMGLKHKILMLENCLGYIVIPKENTYNPLKSYVEHFKTLKQNTKKTNPYYMFWKLLLNALYGKTIQNIDYEKIDIIEEKEDGTFLFKERTFKAGAMYNPLLASLITGYVRSYIFDLEVKYNSMHTSTDSIKTTIKPDKIKELGHNLGDLELSAYGDCQFYRNKTYIHYDNTLKYAHHGFYGRIKFSKVNDEKNNIKIGDKIQTKYTPVENLLEMLIMQKTEYDMQRMANIKESLKRKEEKITPCEMFTIKNDFKVKFNKNV